MTGFAAGMTAGVLIAASAAPAGASGAAGLTATYLGEFRGGGGDAALRGPLAMAFDGAGNLYVAEQEAYRVSVFGPDGGFLRHVGGPLTCRVACRPEERNGRFFLPNGVAVDSAGFVHVSDLGPASNGSTGRVQKFAPDGTFVSALEGVGLDHFSYPRDVAVDASGGLYVADWHNQRVLLLAAGSGALIKEWAAPDFYPLGLAVDDTRGLLYAAVAAGDAARNEIVVVALDGGFVARFGQGSRPGTRLGLDREGRLYTTGSVTVKVFAPGGELLGEWGSYGTGPGQFGQATGIAVDAQGLVYVADYVGNRVQVFHVRFDR